MKFNKLISLFFIFLVFNIHIVQLSRVTRSLTHKYSKKIKARTKNSHLFSPPFPAGIMISEEHKSSNNNLNQIHLTAQATSPLVDIALLKQRIMSSLNKVKGSSKFQYLLGGVYFFIEIISKLPDKPEFKNLRDLANKLLQVEQWSKKCLDQFYFIYEIFTKQNDDELDKKFKEQIDKVSEKDKNDLINTYLYFFGFNGMEKLLNEDPYRMCEEIKLKKHPSLLLDSKNILATISAGDWDEKGEEFKFYEIIVDGVSKFLNEDGKNYDVGKIVCESDPQQYVYKYICTTLLPKNYFSLGEEERKKISHEIYNKFKENLDENKNKLYDDIEKEFHVRKEIFQKLDCNIFPKKSSAKNEGYIAKILKLYGKLKEVFSQSNDLFQNCLNPAYTYVKSKYDDYIQRMEKEKQRIEEEQANRLKEAHSPEEVVNEINRMVDLSLNRVTVTTPEQMMNLFGMFNKYNSISDDQANDVGKLLPNTQVEIDNFVDQTTNKTIENLDLMNKEIVLEPKTTHEENETIALKIIENNPDFKTPSIQQEIKLNKVNDQQASLSKIQVAKDFLINPTSQSYKHVVNIYQGHKKLIDDNIKLLKKEKKSTFKKELKLYKDNPRKLIKDSIKYAIYVQFAPERKLLSKNFVKRVTYEAIAHNKDDLNSYLTSVKLKVTHPYVHSFLSNVWEPKIKSSNNVLNGEKDTKTNYMIISNKIEVVHPQIQNAISKAYNKLQNVLMKNDLPKVSNNYRFRFISRTKANTKNIQWIKEQVPDFLGNLFSGDFKKIYENLVKEKFNEIMKNEKYKKIINGGKDIIYFFVNEKYIQELIKILTAAFGGVVLLVQIMKFKKYYDLLMSFREAFYTENITQRLRLIGRCIGNMINMAFTTPKDFVTEANESLKGVIQWVFSYFKSRKFRRVYRKVKK
jgi:hypothetical protein